MMGKQNDPQAPLFYPGFSFEERIPSDHLLRKISKLVDFTFAYDEVKEKYGKKGNVSIPPPIILKMMLLLILYNISSERELMRSIPLRLDWMWFLGPNHKSQLRNPIQLRVTSLLLTIHVYVYFHV